MQNKNTNCQSYFGVYGILFISIIIYLLSINIGEGINPALADATAPVTPKTEREVILPPVQTDFCGLSFVDCPNNITGIVSAYNNVPEQTDSSPDYAAGGYIADKAGKVVANNCLPLHSKVMIDGNEYEVYDRMNKRYGCNHFDIFMGKDIKSAINFGRKELQVTILK